MREDKHGIAYDLKAKKLWKIQSISEEMAQKKEKTVGVKKKMSKKKTNSEHSQ
jgi:hypothetical protein